MEQMLLPILMFAALGMMMYFGMRKQKRQVAEAQAMQSALVPGTRVMTTSGLQGEITAIADDTLELEIAPGVRTTWIRAAVREVVVPNDAAALGELEVEDADYDSTDYDESAYDSAEYEDDQYESSESSDVSLDKRKPGSDIS